MFRRRKGKLDAYAAARPEDVRVLQALVAHGADLTEPRHVLHFMYLPDQATADEAAQQAPGWTGTTSPPAEGYDTWSLVLERHDYVLTPQNVVDSAQSFAALAERYGGRYDGWEASV